MPFSTALRRTKEMSRDKADVVTKFPNGDDAWTATMPVRCEVEVYTNRLTGDSIIRYGRWGAHNPHALNTSGLYIPRGGSVEISAREDRP
jgi:hypothetical protein